MDLKNAKFKNDTRQRKLKILIKFTLNNILDFTLSLVRRRQKEL